MFELNSFLNSLNVSSENDSLALKLYIFFSQSDIQSKKAVLESVLAEPITLENASILIYLILLLSNSTERLKNLNTFFEKKPPVDTIRIVLLTLQSIKKNNFDFITPKELNGIEKYVVTKLHTAIDLLPLYTSNTINKDKKITKVVIVSGFVIDKKHNSHLYILINAALAIRKVLPETEVYFALTGDRTAKTVFGYQWLGRKTSLFSDVWKDIVMSNSGYVYQSIDIHSGNAKIQDFNQWINDIKPDCIIMHGNVTEATFICRMLFKKYPIIYYPSNVKNIPTCDVDSIIVRADTMYDNIVNYYTKHNKKIPMLFQMSLPLVIKPLSIDSYSGGSLKKSHDELVFAVVIGRNLISKYFCGLSSGEILEFEKLIENNPKLKFVFVGDSNFEAIFEKSKGLKLGFEQGRILPIERIVENEIVSFLSEIDLIFSLPGVTGGAGAIVSAILQKKAATVCSDNDASAYCDSKFLYYDHFSMVKMLQELTRNLFALKECGEFNYQKLISTFGSDICQKFVDCLTSTIECKLNR